MSIKGVQMGEIALDLAPDYSFKTLGAKEMSNNSTRQMRELFESDHTNGKKFFVVAVQISGIEGLELIANHIENAEEKISYYEKAYDPETLVHRHSPDIRIVAYDFVWSLEDAQNLLTK